MTLTAIYIQSTDCGHHRVRLYGPHATNVIDSPQTEGVVQYHTLERRVRLLREQSTFDGYKMST